MISSKTLPENNDSEVFESILQIGHRFVRNGVQQEIFKEEFQSVCFMKGTKKLDEYED